MTQRSIAFIGAGNMAKSIIAGLVNSGYDPKKITVTAPSATRRQPLAEEYGVKPVATTLLVQLPLMWLF